MTTVSNPKAETLRVLYNMDLLTARELFKASLAVDVSLDDLREEFGYSSTKEFAQMFLEIPSMQPPSAPELTEDDFNVSGSAGDEFKEFVNAATQAQAEQQEQKLEQKPVPTVKWSIWHSDEAKLLADLKWGRELKPAGIARQMNLAGLPKTRSSIRSFIRRVWVQGVVMHPGVYEQLNKGLSAAEIRAKADQLNLAGLTGWNLEFMEMIHTLETHCESKAYPMPIIVFPEPEEEPEESSEGAGSS